MVRDTQTGKEIQRGQGICTPRPKRLFTLKEAADYLGRSEWSMRDLMWKRLIPVVKPEGGRKVWFDVKDLDHFIENNKAIYS